MGETSIEWTDKVWNCVRGCTKISPGCKNCYAESFAERFRGVSGHPYEQGFDLRLVPSKLAEPLSWKAPARVFVNSMSDLFHESIPLEYIAAAMGVMAACPHLIFQILTKRVARAVEFFEWIKKRGAMLPSLIGERPPEGASAEASACLMMASSEGVRVGHQEAISVYNATPWPLPNVWIGASVENQEYAEERIPLLAKIPAAVRFLSCEPLLGPLNLFGPSLADTGPFGAAWIKQGYPSETDCGPEWDVELTAAVDWVIVGGESGQRARPFALEWARSIVKQCREAQVACFVKQLGGAPHGEWGDDNAPTVTVDDLTSGKLVPVTQLARHKNGRWRLQDRKGGSMSEWPSDLRVRQFPETVR